MPDISFNNLNSNIVQNGLCVSCGACVLACPRQSLKIINEAPALQSSCEKCGSCYNACPILNMAHKDTLEHVKEGWLGIVTKAALCRVADQSELTKASSGGAVTGLLARLLETNKIDAALVLRTKKDNPLDLEAILATSKEDIFDSAQSKYICYPSLQSLRALGDLPADYKIAVVGLPCQISSLKRIASIKEGMIIYKFALYCGGVLKADVIDYILRWFKTKRGEVESLNYRYGSWPGKFRITSKEKQFSINKHTFNLFHLSHLKKGCLICDDFAGDSSDLSFGDAWIKSDPEKNSTGNTIVISRNRKGDHLLGIIKNNPDLICQMISTEDAMLQHQHSAENKKIGGYIRKKFILNRCRNLPSGNRLDLGTIGFKRVLFEKMYLSAINFFSGKFGQSLISLIPIRLWDKVMVGLRETLIADKKRNINARI